MDIRSDRENGLRHVELGRKYHMDPRTAKRCAESPQKPEYTFKRAQAYEDGAVQPKRRRVAGEAAIFRAAILGKLREIEEAVRFSHNSGIFPDKVG